MPYIHIVVAPAFHRTGKRKHERFDAYLRDTGELICTATRQPLLDASAPGPLPTIQFAAAVSLRQTRHYPRRGMA
jgi:hypothetical protein